MITDKTRKVALCYISELRGDKGRPTDEFGSICPQLPWKRMPITACRDLADLLEELIK